MGVKIGQREKRFMAIGSQYRSVGLRKRSSAEIWGCIGEAGDPLVYWLNIYQALHHLRIVKIVLILKKFIIIFNK